MIERPWLAHYPAGVPADIDPDAIPTLPALFERSFRQYASRTAFTFMGAATSYAEWDRESQALAAWLLAHGLRPGDRVALMLPNLPQFPVAAAAVLRAGLVLVNINPLYTTRELEQQLHDSGASAIVVLENFAHVLDHVADRSALRQVLVTSVGDMLPAPKGQLVDFVIRHLKKAVPRYALAGHVRLRQVLREGRKLPPPVAALQPSSLALLQYTGGTTGVAKAAMLTHRNLIANLLQCTAWYQPALDRRPELAQLNSACALPLYHIFAFTIELLMSTSLGGMMVLLPNPRDLKTTLATLARQPIHLFPAVNTLFNALLHHPDFDKVDWSQLLLSGGGGMAVQEAVAAKWLARTGSAICEGYGLSETSPVVSCNPTDTDHFSGTVGLPLPSTEMAILDEQGLPLGAGQIGEIGVRGPQVMAGYWQRPEESARVFNADGWFRTGDIGVMDAQGYFKVVDRKKDMILVSGFNVYPNEVEEIAVMHPGVLEAAVVGVPDPDSGEAVRLFVVKRDPALDEAELRAFLAERLTGYKRPKLIVFRDELPKTAVGKILRRALRDAGTA